MAEYNHGCLMRGGKPISLKARWDTLNLDKSCVVATGSAIGASTSYWVMYI